MLTPPQEINLSIVFNFLVLLFLKGETIVKSFSFPSQAVYPWECFKKFGERLLGHKLFSYGAVCKSGLATSGVLSNTFK